MGQTVWTRLVPHARSTDVRPALAAEVADPLWLLGRQRQLGELTGSDGGTPIIVDIGKSWSRLTHYRAEGTAATGQVEYLGPAAGPLEARVERVPELAPGDEGAWWPRLAAGRDLARRLRAAGFDELAVRLATHPDTCFAVPPASDAEGSAERRYRLLLSGRAIDGGRVLQLLRNGGLPPDLPAAPGEPLAGLLAQWQAAVAASWGIAEPDQPQPPAWVSDRLEYAFSVAAAPLPDPGAGPGPGSGPALVFRAAEYDGGGLDWYSLDLVTDPASPGWPTAGPEAAGVDDTATSGPGGGAAATGQAVRSVFATPLSFPGAPADRFWELEDGAVALDTAVAEPTSLARLIATEFMLVYSPEWFIAPLDLPLGSVASVDWVVVRDTFGVPTLVGDRARHAVDGVGRQFQPASFGRPGGDHPLLVLPPAAQGPLRSPTRELIAMQRDELANLAWAIEHQVAGPSGRGVVRQPRPAAIDPPEPVDLTDPYELVWRLATAVPDGWIPLVPRIRRRGPQAGARILRKARLLDPVAGLRTARSTLLAGFRDIHDEELTGRGLRVVVCDQLVRWHDGTSRAWRGRQKRPGQGEAASGLRYDDAARPRVHD